MSNNIFEQIKKVNDYGQEYWSARYLCKLLGYTEYGKFLPAIERAKESCKNSGHAVPDHFAEVSKTINMPKTATKQVVDFKLTLVMQKLNCSNT